MPERWQDELKKLRREQMPDGLRERAEAGPRRELPPDGRQRIVAGVVAFAVFVAAGAFAWRAFEEGDRLQDESAVTESSILVRLEVREFDSGAALPDATLAYRGIVLEGSGPSFSWGSTIFDTVGPDFEDVVYLPVPIGTEVVIDSSADRTAVSVENVQENGSREPIDGSRGTASTTTLDRPGRLALVVDGHWAQGDRSFYFPVEVMDPDSVPPIGIIEVTQGQQPHLTVDGVTSVGEIRPAELRDGDVQVLTEPPVASDPMPLSPGTRVWIDAGEAERLSYGWISRPAPDVIDQLVQRPFPYASAAVDLSGVRPGPHELLIGGRWPDDEIFGIGFSIDVQPPTDPATPPDILHLTCTTERATLDATVVRTQPDGVHISVDASDDVRGVDIVTGPETREFSGVGFHVDGHGTRGITIEPGPWHVGCYGGGRSGVGPADIGTDRTAAFTVVDPDDYYAPVDLACEDPTTRLFAVNGTPAAGVAGSYEASPRTVEESAAAVPGILPTDVVREAGYQDGPGFKLGPIYSVLREGRAVARLHVPVEVSSTWGVSVDACPGSGIGPDAPPGAAGPTPDTAIVECLESRTEVATPIVNTQPDGLHIELQSTGTQELIVVGGGERTRVFAYPIEGQGRTAFVVPVHPGHVSISCRSNIGAEETPDPFADRLSETLALQDRGAFFLPYAPTCDSSEEVPLVPPTTFLEPAGESYVRANLSGILDGDTVERAGYLEGRGDEGPWRVVRDGEIVAEVEFPSLEGVTCRGSGITGRS